MERKRAKTDEEAVELEGLDPNLIMSMERLQEAQDELDQANEAANEKVLEIEQTYMEKRRPIYERRNEVIQKIPQFWLTAFLSHPHLRDLLTDEDCKAFKFLKSLSVEDLGDIKSGYKITFEFGPNPYFEDSKLSKVFKYVEDASTAELGNAPHWKDGMDLTKSKKPETKEKKRPRKTNSFFNWFSDPVDADLIVGLMQDEESQIAEDQSQRIAEIIKEDLWVNPLTYFNNENGSDSDGDDDNDDDDDDDICETDEEDDDDENEDDE